MNDATPNDPPSTETEPSKAKKSLSQGQLIFRIVLFAVLALLLVMLGYDRFVARANHEAAYKTLNEMLDETENAEAGDEKIYTRDDVHEKLGREPISEEEGANYVLEHYRWRSGLLFRTYDLYVSYSPKQTMEISTVSVGKRPFPKPAQPWVPKEAGSTDSEPSDPAPADAAPTDPAPTDP